MFHMYRGLDVQERLMCRFVGMAKILPVPTLEQSTGDIIHEKGIYGIVDKELSKIVYVGTTGKSFLIRWSSHLRSYQKETHNNPHLCKIFDKNNFYFMVLQVIDTDLTREDYDDIEREWIFRLNTHVKFGGCNQSVKKPDGTSY